MSDHKNDAAFTADEEAELTREQFDYLLARRTNFEDVKAFHEKFDVPVRPRPQLLPEDELAFRLGFLKEEVMEFQEAHDRGDIAEAFDALLDLVYVAHGTALMMGLPWQEGWNEVQRANMSKMSARDILAQMPDGTTPEDIGARHISDVRKPEGWQPPNIEAVLRRG